MLRLMQDTHTTFDFPPQLTEKYQPQTIDDFAGLEDPKAIFRNLIARPIKAAYLLTGPSGTGKTTMALAVARALKAELHHIASHDCDLETVERVCRTCHYVPMSGCNAHVILIDEADQMTTAAQIVLLSKLDPICMPPRTIWIATANATDRLQDRLLSRFHQVPFTAQGLAKPGAKLLESIWEREAPASATPPNFLTLMAGNNMRESVMRLESRLQAI